MASQGKRPADGPLQPITQDSIPPSAKRRVRRRLAEHEEYIRNHCGDVYRHDPAKEAPPDLPLYHSEFSKAESACLRIPNHWLDAIDAIKDPQLTAVLEPEITRMLKTYKSKPESVAVVGRIRQGKSRLIEALLGIDQIAKSGATRIAGPQVPIVYSPRPANSQIPYQAKIEVIDPRACLGSVRQHLGNIIVGFEEHSASSPWANDQASDSMKVLTGLFRGHSEFASEDAIRAFLGYTSGTSESQSLEKRRNALRACIEWAEERRLEIPAVSKIHTTNVTELWHKIAPFANDETTTGNNVLDFKPTLLVGKIEIFGEFRVRCSLGDCPGLDDINEDRKTKAKRYLEDCKVVIAVEEITQAGDNSFLNWFLQDRCKNRPDQRVIVVLSKGDTGLNSADRTKTSFEEHEIADLDWLARRREIVGRAKDNYDWTQFWDRKRCACEIAYIDLEEREFHARERSRRIEDQLRSRYAGLSDNFIVRTTCANDCMRHVKDYDQHTANDLPLSVQSTQIPSLIKDLADVANDRAKDHLKRLCGQMLPELLSFAELVRSTILITSRARPNFNPHEYDKVFRALHEAINRLEEVEDEMSHIHLGSHFSFFEGTQGILRTYQHLLATERYGGADAYQSRASCR